MDPIKCSNCGKENQLDSKFCNYCGTKLEKKEEPSLPKYESPHDISVSIVLPSGATRSATLTDNDPVKELVPELVEKLELATTGPDGRPMKYALESTKLNRRLREQETLKDAGVPAEDRLKLVVTSVHDLGTQQQREEEKPVRIPVQTPTPSKMSPYLIAALVAGVALFVISCPITFLIAVIASSAQNEFVSFIPAALGTFVGSPLLLGLIGFVTYKKYAWVVGVILGFFVGIVAIGLGYFIPWLLAGNLFGWPMIVFFVTLIAVTLKRKAQDKVNSIIGAA